MRDRTTIKTIANNKKARHDYLEMKKGDTNEYSK